MIDATDPCSASPSGPSRRAVLAGAMALLAAGSGRGHAQPRGGELGVLATTGMIR